MNCSVSHERTQPNRTRNNSSITYLPRHTKPQSQYLSWLQLAHLPKGIPRKRRRHREIAIPWEPLSRRPVQATGPNISRSVLWFKNNNTQTNSLQKPRERYD